MVLDQKFLGNTVLDWGIATGVVLLTGGLLIAVRMQGLRWLAARNTKGHSRSIGWALSAFEGTQPWFLIAVAVFVGLQFVAIPPKVDRFVEHLTIIAVIAQAADHHPDITIHFDRVTLTLSTHDAHGPRLACLPF